MHGIYIDMDNIEHKCFVWDFQDFDHPNNTFTSASVLFLLDGYLIQIPNVRKSKTPKPDTWRLV